MDGLHRAFNRAKNKVKKKLAPRASASGGSSAGGSVRSASPSVLPRASTDQSGGAQAAASTNTVNSSKAVHRPVLEAHVGRSRLDTEISGESIPDGAHTAGRVPEVPRHPGAHDETVGYDLAPVYAVEAIANTSNIEARESIATTIPREESITQTPQRDVDLSSPKQPDNSDASQPSKVTEPIKGETTLSDTGERPEIVSGRSAMDITKSAAKLALKTVEKVSDALPPLKSVATALNLIVENVELASDNHDAVKRLHARIEKLRDKLAVERIDINEMRRQDELEKELRSIATDLEPLKAQNKVKGFITASDDAGRIKGYIQKVDAALNDYQVSVMQDLHKLNIEQIELAELLLLEKLSSADDAAFNASDARSSCLPLTRVEILDALQEWVNNPNAKQVYWLYGHAGSGKSTIAQSFAEWLFAEGKLGGSFFCSRDSDQRSNTKTIFSTLSYQLATGTDPAAPGFRKSVMKALKAKPKIASLSLQNQLEELLVIPAAASGMTTVIVIDALDECKDEETTSVILKFLDKNVKYLPNIKFFITSRPETHIREGFRLEVLKAVTDVMILHEVAALSVDGDIMVFLETKLTSTAALANRSETHLPQEWPTKDQLAALTKKSGGLFIFASTVIKLILDKNGKPARTLEAILEEPDSFVQEGASALNGLYRTILERAFSAKNDTMMEMRRAILGLLVVACDPLSPIVIAGMLGIDDVDDVKTCLRSLHSLLVVPDDDSRPIRFHHKSFPDFLTDCQRCTDPRFYIDKDKHHLKTAQGCLAVMNRQLKRNICGLQRYSTNVSLSSAVRDARIGESLRYSCRYWPSHLLLDSRRDEHLQDTTAQMLDEWLKTKLLQWFEVLSLLRELGRGVEALNDMREWLVSGDQQHSALGEFVTDSHRFLLSFFDIIQTSAAQLYHSALPFAPKTLLWDIYSAQELYSDARVLQGRGMRWTSLVRTIQVPNSALTARYSYDGSMLAVGGSEFNQLYRSGTGERLAELQSGYGIGWVLSVSFSHDHRTLATASGRRILLWDISTGSRISSLLSDGADIFSMEYHPHIDYLVVAGDINGRVFVWDVRDSSRTAFDVARSRGRLCWVRQHERKCVLVGCENGRMEMWDVDPPQRVRSLSLPSSGGTVSAVASSGDGSLVASGSDDGRLAVYNAHTADIVQSFMHNREIFSIAFSPTAAMLAFGSKSGDVGCLFYGAHASNRLAMLVSHQGWVRSVEFSPNGRFLASASGDKTVCIWETDAVVPVQDDGHHSQWFDHVHFSDDGQLVVSISGDEINVWDTCTGALCMTLKGHPWAVRDVVILPNNAHIISADYDKNLILWDWREGKILSSNEATSQDYGDFVFLFPYPHKTPILGIISTHIGIDNESKRMVCCWAVDGSETGNTRIVLTAHAVVNTYSEVLRITHRGSIETADLTLVLECNSGEQFSALWHNSAVVTNPPQELQFVEEAEESPLKGAEWPLTASEAYCRLSEDHDWILDEHDRRVLWVPLANRAYHGRWHGRRLAIAGNSGQFTLVNFSNVNLSNDDMF